MGFDANSLYPWAMTQDMPTGFGIVRRSENGFKLDMSSKHRQSKIASQVNYDTQFVLNELILINSSTNIAFPITLLRITTL